MVGPTRRRLHAIAAAATVVVVCGAIARRNATYYGALFGDSEFQVGSIDGELPPTAEVRSPDGRWLARLDGVTVQLTDALGLRPDRQLSDGINRPKALAINAHRLAVLWHRGSDDHPVQFVLAIDLDSCDTRGQRFTVLHQPWYHELAWLDHDRVGLLDVAARRGTVVDVEQATVRSASTWALR